VADVPKSRQFGVPMPMSCYFMFYDASEGRAARRQSAAGLAGVSPVRLADTAAPKAGCGV
jgi:hypothetical protein